MKNIKHDLYVNLYKNFSHKSSILLLLLLTLIIFFFLFTFTLLLRHCQPLTYPQHLLIQVIAYKTPQLHTILTYRSMSAFHVQNINLVVPAFQARMLKVFQLLFWYLHFLHLCLCLATVLVCLYFLQLLKRFLLVFHVLLVQVLLKCLFLLLSDFRHSYAWFLLHHLFVK